MTVARGSMLTIPVAASRCARRIEGERAVLGIIAPSQPRLRLDRPVHDFHSLLHLRRELFAEVFRPEERTEFDMGLLARTRGRAAFRPLERFVHRLHFPEPIACDELFGLG